MECLWKYDNPTWTFYPIIPWHLQTKHFQLHRTQATPLPLEQLEQATVLRLATVWLLMGMREIHHHQHAELKGLEALLHSPFAKDWHCMSKSMTN